MRYTVMIEPTDEPDHPGWCYAHVPTLGLTTHGQGIDGARAAAQDLIQGWISERVREAKREHRPDRAVPGSL